MSSRACGSRCSRVRHQALSRSSSCASSRAAAIETAADPMPVSTARAPRLRNVSWTRSGAVLQASAQQVRHRPATDPASQARKGRRPSLRDCASSSSCASSSRSPSGVPASAAAERGIRQSCSMRTAASSARASAAPPALPWPRSSRSSAHSAPGGKQAVRFAGARPLLRQRTLTELVEGENSRRGPERAARVALRGGPRCAHRRLALRAGHEQRRAGGERRGNGRRKSLLVQ